MKPYDLIIPLILVLFGVAGSYDAAYGQLISPGRLSDVHQHPEGIKSCTTCHELGNRGISNRLCLDCHTPLLSRIELQRGYHATVADQNCASCHREHFGRTFNSINWDTARFDHGETGYELIGKHMDLNCRDCHTPSYITDEEVIRFKQQYLALDHTFLGVGTACEHCHESDSPHAGQFLGQTCSDCHTPADWTDMALFDHDRSSYKLLGEHIQVGCESCHRTETTAAGTGTRYTGLNFDECSDCHEDEHSSRLGEHCSGCHSEQGWHRFADFPEESYPHEETGFVLLGRHAAIRCSSCHTATAPEEIDLTFSASTRSYTYPHPESENCLSCHLDFHEGVFTAFAGGSTCDNCHTSESWLPARFDIDRHNAETSFTLTGAHRATPCFSCHLDSGTHEYAFTFENPQCESCHEVDNPHGDEFNNGSGTTLCADCHSTGSWRTETTFSHDDTGFPLTGAHITVACNDCHTPLQQTGDDRLMRRFDDLATDCESCHSGDDPHQGQFAESSIGTSCSDCHDTESFRLQGFDHGRTRFPLDGAHTEVPCLSCHATERTGDGDQFVRFRPLELTCGSCHGSKN